MKKAVKNSCFTKGFTLIELLVVVLIIGILAAVALPQYQKAVEKSRVSEMQLELASLEKAVDVYALENGVPAATEEEPIDVMSSLVLDYTGSFAYNESNRYCDAKNICISTEYSPAEAKWLVCVDSRRKSGFQGAPDYYLCSAKNAAGGGWTKTYHSCDVNIDNLGLKSFGYQQAEC